MRACLLDSGDDQTVLCSAEKLLVYLETVRECSLECLSDTE